MSFQFVRFVFLVVRDVVHGANGWDWLFYICLEVAVRWCGNHVVCLYPEYGSEVHPAYLDHLLVKATF